MDSGPDDGGSEAASVPGAGEPSRADDAGDAARASATAFDVVVGAADLTLTIGVRAVVTARALLGPAVSQIAHHLAYPPLVPTSRAPGTLVARLGARGARRRRESEDLAVRSARQAVPLIADAVLDQIDLTALVLSRVDLLSVVSVVLDQLDLTELVTKQVALGDVVQAALDDLDLTATVLDRVDLQRIVTHVLDGLDLTALVRERVDLDSLANQVIDDVDLPEIIRDSSSGVAADLVVEARSGAASADEVVARAVDRVLVWRRNRERGDR
ncbi:hypothetical protein FE697_015185 [Mumia zhuanghuii]|uniref:Uncharacterized protein n=2 Tax=Mumia TaxID=1546255 RepID=A0ABW1QRU2_9ACTN|nr:MULTISPECIES: hypothetical protein [Mumia]KAA1422478.1 hypothetical protein FE697_015185 [Mumia zhuanghuii]